MQNPNEDTQWNDVLRSKGILPQKPNEATIDEQTILQVIKQAVRVHRPESGRRPYWVLNAYMHQRLCILITKVHKKP